MHTATRLFTFVLVCGGLINAAQARVWADKTGDYTVEADLFAFNDEHVIVQRKEDGQLGMYEIAALSDEDQKYLKTEEAAQVSSENLDKEQAWTMKDGYRLVGRIVDYARVTVTFQRRRGKSYVNDRLYKSLPPIYQAIIRKSIEQLAGIDNVDDRKVDSWLVSLKGQPQSYDIEGVVIELKDGNEYTVPFFLFNDESLKNLKGGWDEWSESHKESDHESKDEEAFRLQSNAAAMHHENEAYRQQAMDREIAVANLTFNAVTAGVTSLWEVTLYPGNGNMAAPGWVVVPGRDSRQAAYNALQQYPGFVTGPIRRVSSRRYR